MTLQSSDEMWPRPYAPTVTESDAMARPYAPTLTESDAVTDLREVWIVEFRRADGEHADRVECVFPLTGMCVATFSVHMCTAVGREVLLPAWWTLAGSASVLVSPLLKAFLSR
jgi:hypothetical protein